MIAIPLPYKAVAVFALVAGAAIIGYVKGNSAGRIEQLQDTVEAYEKRKGIDNAVSGVNRYRVCVDLGGVRDECEQLRGVDEAAEGE